MKCAAMWKMRIITGEEAIWFARNFEVSEIWELYFKCSLFPSLRAFSRKTHLTRNCIFILVAFSRKEPFILAYTGLY